MIKSKKKLKVLAADFLNSLPLTIEVKEDDYFDFESVSYTHLRAHETVLDLVCRLLLEKKK